MSQHIAVTSQDPKQSVVICRLGNPNQISIILCEQLDMSNKL